MPHASQNIVQHLQKAASELEAFEADLKEGLGPRAYNQLVDWIGAHAPNATASIWSVVGARCEHLAALGNQVSAKETQEQGQARIRSYFQDVNPGPIAQELLKACSLPTVWSTYDGAVSRLECSQVIGPIARRYHLPEQAVVALCSASMAPLRPALEALGIHAGQMRAHGELLQSIRSGQAARTGVGIAASIAGGLLLGPLGAIGARLLTGAATDPTDMINASTERVSDTFEGFRAAFVTSMEDVDANVLYTLASLYGGLLLRIEQDLNSVGKSLVAVDLATGEVELGLSPMALADFDTWARWTLEQLASLRRGENWGHLADGADKALRLAIADPLRANVVGGDEATAYTVEFARLRAVAINRAADIAWTEGRVGDAQKLYRHLISGTNVAWERAQVGQDTPEDEALHTAGLRLATLATIQTNEGDHTALNSLAALPAFVAQALSRFAADEAWIGVPGEGLSGTTIMTAVMIARYAEEHNIDLGLAGRLPKAVGRNGGLAKWQALAKEQIAPAAVVLQLVDARTRAAHTERSRFLTWLVERAAREEKRETLLAWVVLSVLGAGLVVGGYYIVRWIFF